MPPSFTDPLVTAFDSDPRPLDTNGPIVSESNKQKRTMVYSAEKIRPRISSATRSCMTVNPVTYAHPAAAPTTATRKIADVNDDTAPAPMIAPPVATTAVVNTASLGRRPCTAMSATTPSAQPTPSAVKSSPKVDGPPPSTSRANSGPRGTIIP